MNSDTAAHQLINAIRIIQLVNEEGSRGIELREIWVKLKAGGAEIPRACLISQVNRLVEDRHLVEERKLGSKGYVRRFYDPGI